MYFSSITFWVFRCSPLQQYRRESEGRERLGIHTLVNSCISGKNYKPPGPNMNRTPSNNELSFVQSTFESYRVHTQLRRILGHSYKAVSDIA